MAEQNSEQVEAVILDSGDGQTLVADLPSDEGEGENAGKSEAVAIAEIHAETEIAVTAINADVEQARIEAENERVRICQEMDAENAALRASMTEREREIAELRAQLSQVQANPST
jgi:dynactin complex subunit